MKKKCNRYKLMILCWCVSSNTIAQDICTSKTKNSSAETFSSSYGSSFGLFSSNTIAINGNFTINTNFTITNKTLLMAPNTKIIVTAGKTLTIRQSLLYSCGNQLWDGIEIQPGGTLNIAKNTWIEDAKIAVLSDNNGGVANFTIQNTTFNRNYIGIKVENYTSSVPHPGTIRACTFDSRNSNTSTVNTPLLDAPYQTQNAEMGVYLFNVSNFQVGVTLNPATKNNFRYLNIGIRGLAANYKVFNNDFRNNAPNGWAIVNTKSSTMQAGDALPNYPNNFENLWNGISHTSSSDLAVLYNRFNNINVQGFAFSGSSVAVYTFECNDATIQLSNNNLNTINTGFKHFKNSNATYKVTDNVFNTFTGQAVACIENQKGTIDVVQNQFTGVQNMLYSGNTAVYVANTVLTLTTPMVNINRNHIGKINKGIHVVGMRRPIVEVNDITFAPTISPLVTQFYFGIRSQNCSSEEIHNNTVDKIGSDPISSYVNALYGVSVETSSNIPAVSENTVKKMGSGFRFRGFYDGADFRCNTMTNNWYGLTIDNAKIGDQGAASSGIWPNGLAGDNFWTDSSLIGSNTAVIGLGTIYPAAFYTRSAGYGFTPVNTHISPIQTIRTFTSPFPYTLTDGFVPLADQLCQTICYDPSTCKIPRLAKIARNETPFDQIVGTERFTMHEAVLKTVWQDSLVLDTTTIDGRDLQLFVDTVSLSNVGLVVEVSKLMAAKDTLAAEQLNMSINPKECADAFHKTVNEIYFRTWAKNLFEFTPTDSNTLTNIALQDPLVCGTAIYSARVMLNKDVNDYSVDNNQGNRLMNTVKTEAAPTPSTSKGKWYPNPAKNEVNYEIQLPDEQSGQLMVVDLTGKVQATERLNGGNNKINFDVKMLPNGIYFYRVMVNNTLQEVNKFIIQH